MERRDFLGRLGLVMVLPGVTGLRGAQGQDQEQVLPGQGNVGTLRDPRAVGRPRTPTETHENEPEIQRIEQRLACTCGCTLDIFTCRTTDFTCTYSPALHREVLALWNEGKRGDEIVNAFVAKYGEKALMAPKPEGFNLAGYLVPGVTVLAASGLLLALLLRRRTAVAAAPAVSDAASSSSSSVVPPDATPEELERLRQALSEADD